MRNCKGILRLVVAGLMLFGGRADAATAIGSCLTNVVCATMWDGPLGQNPYTVSYCSSAMVCVVPPPRFELLKFVSLDGASLNKNVVAGAGSTVTFSMCLYNGAAVAVDGITINDRMPPNLAIANPAPVGTWTLGNYHKNVVAPGLVLAWNTTGFVPGMPAGSPGVGQVGPVYMRWTISRLEALKSACVVYRAVVQ